MAQRAESSVSTPLDGEEPPARVQKKRTKTGCLTCRSRRIKCSEERPFCSQCVKSRRKCEGYDHVPSASLPVNAHTRLQENAFPHAFDGESLGYNSTGYVPLSTQPLTTRLDVRNESFVPDLITQNVQQTQWYTIQNGSQIMPAGQSNLWYPDTVNSSIPSTYLPGSVGDVASQADMSSGLNQSTIFSLPPTPASEPPTYLNQQYQPLHGQYRDRYYERFDPNMLTPASELTITPYENSHNIWQPGSTDVPTDEAIGLYMPVSQTGTSFGTSTSTIQAFNTGSMLDDAAIERYQDASCNIWPEEGRVTSANSDLHGEITSRSGSFNAADIVADLAHMQLVPSDIAAAQTMVTFRPEHAVNPLQNAATAQIFAFFIQFTAWAITDAGRTSCANSAQINYAVHPPMSQAGLWTHKIPELALQDIGLLQAMLAIASLHIAKFTRSSPTPSLKHYAYAQKFLSRSLADTSQRHNVVTIAISMLLAIYELWSTQHAQWSTHLAGAGHLLQELDLLTIQRKVELLRLQKLVRHEQEDYDFGSERDASMKWRDKQYRDLDQVPLVEDELVGILAGRPVPYLMSAEFDVTSLDLSDIDIVKYELQRDLFWIYCKQDIVGSLITGNPLILPFFKWTDCAPRAPINCGELYYGAFDHLFLLLGRIVDFSVRDRNRRIKLMHHKDKIKDKMSAGSSAAMTGTAGKGSSRAKSSKQAAKSKEQAMPEFYGLAPPSSFRGLPRSFRKNNIPVKPEVILDDPIDLNEATRLALAEWNAIKAAMEHYVYLLGPQYQPIHVLDNDSAAAFDKTCLFPTYEIADLWAHTNLAWILIHRAHPDMPPQAHAAAAAAASQTTPFVDSLGRIVMGICMSVDLTNLNARQCKTISNMCLPLFFAAIQMVDPVKRAWVITTLFDIQRYCLLDTAGVIAMGCQEAWYRSGLAGRGPPYEMRFDTRDDDAEIGRETTSSGPIPPSTSSDSVSDRRFVHYQPG